MKQELDFTEAESNLRLAGLTQSQIDILRDYYDYFTAPASANHHLNVQGGLAVHSVNVTNRLVELTNALSPGMWPSDESPYRIGMLHDLCKAATYTRAPVAGWERKASAFPGQGMASVALAGMQPLGIALAPVEAACIAWHMGVYGLTESERDSYDEAMNRWPRQLIATHTADVWAARVDESNDILI